MLFANLAA